jgi:hypothetical protein
MYSDRKKNPHTTHQMRFVPALHARDQPDDMAFLQEAATTAATITVTALTAVLSSRATI